jgi:hypothetical protein
MEEEEMEFTTIAQHWQHYLERDVPGEASTVQAESMKHAFAAGAISGLHLALKAVNTPNRRQAQVDIDAHLAGIRALGGLV